jgi:cellulose synthase/poly-beta-1,6-N-acetylglucosamine synthase-like glycosyltransferase
MKDAGVIFRGKKYITHSTLEHTDSALKVISLIHMFVFLIILLFAILLSLKFGFLTLLVIIICFLTLLYFSDLLFNLFLVGESFKKTPEIKIEDNELEKSSNFWPTYTVFCPLYKEASVLPQFIKAIKQLDYPKNKLQVILLFEEDDAATIQLANSLDLPDYFEIVVVPDSNPRTKPKAVNFGLSIARGEYVVIFDAEDIPDKKQLKKAVIAFREYISDDVACIQAKLNFYNPRQNLLTMFFTAEYSLWFDLILTGLQSINAPIPLGGTSNHFRLKTLMDLKGWDPFNVTEDCDLGIRIWKKGMSTAILDSTTWEEANSNLKNWFRQRSRWIKGYIQTFLVHYRKPVTLFKENRNIHIFSLNLIIVGKIISIFINPLMWFITIIYFFGRVYFGSTIESLFPSQIYYIAVISLVFGNFLYVYYMLLGLAKRGYYDLVLIFPLIPLYWLMISVAAWISLHQLIFKPHYWEKTNHGLHLKLNKS